MKRKRKTRPKLKPRDMPGARAIHRNIIRFREAHGWTPTQFAAKLSEVTKTKVDLTVVWHWENGDTAPSGRILPSVADLLGVTIDELYREAA